MLPGQDEGAADFLVQTLAPFHFPFSVSSFRPGNLDLFGALLQPPAQERRNILEQFLALRAPLLKDSMKYVVPRVPKDVLGM